MKMQSIGVIRRIVERDGEFMVSFPEYAGYFSVAHGDTYEEMVARLRAAAESGATITFCYDADHRIIDIL